MEHQHQPGHQKPIWESRRWLFGIAVGLTLGAVVALLCRQRCCKADAAVPAVAQGVPIEVDGKPVTSPTGEYTLSIGQPLIASTRTTPVDIEEFRSRCAEFYAHYSPEKVPEVDAMIQKRQQRGGGEQFEVMWTKMQQKYGPWPPTEPVDTERHSTGESVLLASSNISSGLVN